MAKEAYGETTLHEAWAYEGTAGMVRDSYDGSIDPSYVDGLLSIVQSVPSCMRSNGYTFRYAVAKSVERSSMTFDDSLISGESLEADVWKIIDSLSDVISEDQQFRV